MKWKDLEIGNLPPDILTGDYDWEYIIIKGEWVPTDHIEEYLYLLRYSQGHIRYRKPGPKQPTHEELQKRIFDTLAYLNCGVVHQYETIIKLLTGRKSADIPPEA